MDLKTQLENLKTSVDELIMAPNLNYLIHHFQELYEKLFPLRTKPLTISEIQNSLFREHVKNSDDISKNSMMDINPVLHHLLMMTEIFFLPDKEDPVLIHTLFILFHQIRNFCVGLTSPSNTNFVLPPFDLLEQTKDLLDLLIQQNLFLIYRVEFESFACILNMMMTHYSNLFFVYHGMNTYNQFLHDVFYQQIHDFINLPYHSLRRCSSYKNNVNAEIFSTLGWKSSQLRDYMKSTWDSLEFDCLGTIKKDLSRMMRDLEYIEEYCQMIQYLNSFILDCYFLNFYFDSNIYIFEERDIQSSFGQIRTHLTKLTKNKRLRRLLTKDIFDFYISALFDCSCQLMIFKLRF